MSLDLPNPRAPRIASIDALRGLVMLLMVFVNDIASAPGVPWWMRHYYDRAQRGDYNGMTWVDWVFPAFLFVVGLSIPAAMLARRARDEPAWQTAMHVVWRTACLLILGVFMVNRPADAQALGWPAGLWEALALGAGILFVLQLPERWPAATWAARVLGAAALVYLGWAYVGPDGSRLETKWWGILGLIGWAYLVGAVMWALAGAGRGALAAAAAMLLALFALEAAGKMPRLSLGDGFVVNDYLSFGAQIGTHGALVVLGMLAATVFGSHLAGGAADAPPADTAGKVRWLAGFAALALVAAVLCYPLFGINKDVATPSWALISAAATALLLAPVYAWVDGSAGKAGLASSWLLRAAGQNALMIYLLQALLYQVFAVTGFTLHGEIGAMGVWHAYARAAALAVMLALVAWILARAGVRLRL